MRMLGPEGVVLVVGGTMMRMLGPGLPEGSGRVRGVGRWLPCRLSLACVGLGAGAPLFRLARLGGTGVGGAGGGVGFEEGLRSLLAWVPQRGFCRRLHGRFRVAAREDSASLRTVSGGSGGHGSAARLLWKGWWRS